MEFTGEIDLYEVLEAVLEKIDLDAVAEQVREDLDIGGIAYEIVESYTFERAVQDAADNAVETVLDGRVESAVEDALGDFDATDVLDTLQSLIERVATLEAALAAAGKTLAEPARRVLHGVEIPDTTTDLF